MEVDYEEIGRGYADQRQTDPAIAAQLEAALGDARTVLNVGAGTGSYEPAGRELTAVEPSAEMITQRPPGATPRGLRELRRVARDRVLVLNADPGEAERFWLTREYLPGFLDLIPSPYRVAGHWGAELRELLGATEILPVPVPHDCRDGFFQSYWRRPHAYLDPAVRDANSVFHRLAPAEVAAATARLGRDLESGAWDDAHRDLLELTELDVGLRLVVT